MNVLIQKSANEAKKIKNIMNTVSGGALAVLIVGGVAGGLIEIAHRAFTGESSICNMHSDRKSDTTIPYWEREVSESIHSILCD